VKVYTPFANSAQPWSFPNDQTASLIYWTPTSYSRALLYEYPVALDAIEQAAMSQPNWDGFGALPINTETKNNAINAINSIMAVAPAPEINPNPNGTLSFQWGTPEGTAHMEIGQTRYSFYVSPRVGEAILFEGDVGSVHRLHGGLVASLLFPPTNSAPTMTPVRFGTDV
jgi:hypothetical protein